MQELQVILTPQQSVDTEAIKEAAAKLLGLPSRKITGMNIVRRSVDARQRQIRVLLTLQIGIDNEPMLPPYTPPSFQDVSNAEHQVVIVGAGPAGLFAALTLLEHGIRPIIIEQGKDVSHRKIDIASICRNRLISRSSNYCFGEGGAGTFSDGKLFSRSRKRGDMQRVMELFHHFGAGKEVLYETHAHIGSDHLPTIIQNIRQAIIKHGGIVRFSTAMKKLIIENGRVAGIVTHLDEQIQGDAVILATGHSAHDIYEYLFREGITLESKGFAMGVRVEHPQSLIDRLFYHLSPQTDNSQLIGQLGHAAYSLVTQVDVASVIDHPLTGSTQRGVYSFCMCPGGHIVPAASSSDGLVVNGMSASHRNSPYANSGIVVEIHPDDLPRNFHLYGPIAGLRFQQYVERLALEHGERYAIAPAQRLSDFVDGRASATLPPCSYLPAITPSRLDQWLPEQISEPLRQGFSDFDKKHQGFLTNDAVVVGVESRSSSPLRLPRDKETMQHVDVAGLYPVGEGAGYAGGITSSALDGIRAAEKIATEYGK